MKSFDLTQNVNDLLRTSAAFSSETDACRSMMHRLDCKDAKAQEDDNQRKRALKSLTKDWQKDMVLPCPTHAYESLVELGLAERHEVGGDTPHVVYRRK